jgi:hypothetical protein
MSDTDRDPNSLFTRALLPQLRAPGLSLPEIATRVRREVVALARNAQHQQTPAYYDELLGDFVLRPGSASPNAGGAELAAAQKRLEQLEAQLKKQQLAASNPQPIEREIRLRSGKPFDGHWFFNQVGDAVRCAFATTKGSFLVDQHAIIAWGVKGGEVKADGAFSFARPNPNFPRAQDTMVFSGNLKDGEGTFTSGKCVRKLAIAKDRLP